MAHAERQAWPDTAAAVADLPSKGNSSAAATLGSVRVRCHLRIALGAAFRTVAPGSMADFLALANQQQGLISGYSVPVGASHMLSRRES